MTLQFKHINWFVLILEIHGTFSRPGQSWSPVQVMESRGKSWKVMEKESHGNKFQHVS